MTDGAPVEVGNVEHTQGVAIGSNNQAVNVTIGKLEPPDTQRETIQAMWKMLVTDKFERLDRQSETDAHRQYVTERLDRIEQQIHAPTEHLGRLDGQVLALGGRIDTVETQAADTRTDLQVLGARIDAQMKALGLRTVVALALGGAALVLIGVVLYVTYVL